MSKQSLGKLGEEKAAQFLKKQGYKIIGQNFHSRFGEIDVIAQKGQTLVFVEVKTRISNAFGTPEEAVTWYKIQRLLKTVHYYLSIGDFDRIEWRIDLIAIQISDRGKVESLRHIKGLGIDNP